ncbi:hypothetical protein BK011_06785 [Tenericutes bacterium MZ-XQ]|nr:hypothetical protein BK011_06785 [Tenericutes bacterium MZ-XQ]
MVENISSKMVKARKKYRCMFSGKTINIGDEHICQVNKDGGEIYTFRIHKEAEYLAEELDLYGKGTYNDGFQDDDYEQLLQDYIYDNDLFDEYDNFDGSSHDFVYKHYTSKAKEVEK